VSSNKIVDLLAVPAGQHDVGWLQESLQAAVELELSTIPPYLCALWSIKQASTDPNSAYALIQSVVLEEMLHMGFACNMLVAIGGTPAISATTYPGALPGGVRPELNVYLAGLSKDVVQDVFMQIEMPEHPVALGAEEFPTIGAFYDAIAAAFNALRQASFPTDRQLIASFSHMPTQLTRLATLSDVQNAIETIKEQGEGTSTSPDAPISKGELAHYYRFGEISAGKTLIKVSTNPDKWAYDGQPVVLPDVWPMAPVPAGGYPGVSDQFNGQYATVLSLLEQAWRSKGGSDGQTLLSNAIGKMFGLKSLAVPLMQKPLPTGGGNYGPDFRAGP